MADTSAGEPRRIIPALGPFYDQTRDLSWLIVRLTAGGFLLIHGLQKLFNATFTVWAANVLSKRGIEPAIPLAICVWFIETVGAVCIMLGLYTRVFVAMAGVQMLVIIFFAHWGGGFAGFPWNRPTGGWEYAARSGAASCSRSDCVAAALTRSTASSDENSSRHAPGDRAELLGVVRPA